MDRLPEITYTATEVAAAVADYLGINGLISAKGNEIIVRLTNGQAFIFTGKEINDPVEFTD